MRSPPCGEPVELRGYPGDRPVESWGLFVHSYVKFRYSKGFLDHLRQDRGRITRTLCCGHVWCASAWNVVDCLRGTLDPPLVGGQKPVHLFEVLRWLIREPAGREEGLLIACR